MKKLFLLIIIAFITVGLNAEGLKVNASHIKKSYPTEYESTIKKHAVEEWKIDFSMVVYEINKQSDALVELIDEFKSENTNIAFRAIQEWSIEGYKSANIKVFEEITTFGLKYLLKMHCDWSMVKYEYDKQVKAKNSF